MIDFIDATEPDWVEHPVRSTLLTASEGLPSAATPGPSSQMTESSMSHGSEARTSDGAPRHLTARVRKNGSVRLRTALEAGFPTFVVNQAAEKESWRKEIHRPATHTHKWWAQRLGTVFRGILVSAFTEDESHAEAAFVGKFNASGQIVFDPFAGSGTTVAEALKLGCKAIGQDINPVASLVQRQAVAEWDRSLLDGLAKEVEDKARAEIDNLHRSAAGEDVLYYFWVAQSRCEACPPQDQTVDLFSSYVFARHAYPKKFPKAQAICPRCSAVVEVDTSSQVDMTCSRCSTKSPFVGPVKGQMMVCRRGHVSKVLTSLGGVRPSYKMYAKLVLKSNGNKVYEPVDDFDRDLYARSQELLAQCRDKLVLPTGDLAHGANTKQAISWGFRKWTDFFNDRQLYCLGLLGAAIRDLPFTPEREALAALFSGSLEFNNMFCSFKGEGTGAVRHMFSNHILKPERVPLEAHPWGTPASSGAFSTLYKSRLLRALEYKLAPHDIVASGERVTGLSAQLCVPLCENGQELLVHDGAAAMIATGSSSSVDLPDDCVDVIATDPPFFDNVHYSELADFFHAWLSVLRPYPGYPGDIGTTRNDQEVQQTDADAFEAAIADVWRECARVLKPHGLLAFTFHQARAAGWVAVMKALSQAGFVVTAVVPVKGEMSTSTTKSAASDPSNLDSIVVCRLGTSVARPSFELVADQLRAIRDSGVAVGFADVQSVVQGNVLARLTWPSPPSEESLVGEAVKLTLTTASDLGIKSAKNQSRTLKRPR